MEYKFQEIEKRWQKYWVEHETYKIVEDSTKPKKYILDMFPYPSGAGLHVGHPLGYIASDILSRYYRHKGYNVLHPMGYDAYGLPAEQYAIQTGQHPEVTTRINTERYREQLDNIGFSFDWSREVMTCDPTYYKWTQWAFVEMFESYFDNVTKKARPIEELVQYFETKGTQNLDVACSEEFEFTSQEWLAMSERQQQETLMNYRIAYQGETMVNWCAALGTVLANDEVVEGLSVRGGFPVEQKMMRQWQLRVSAYADRLLEGLNKLDWSNAIKETQRNWIGKSSGALVHFQIKDREERITVFTTRPDTLFGVTFMVLAPESELVDKVTSPTQREAVEAYVLRTKKRTERERMIDHSVSGVFSGGYAVHPITGQELPIWLSDYVLAGYGTGAVMAVPGHDTRDFAFARHFELPIIPVVKPTDVEISDNPMEWEGAVDSHEGVMINSDFLNGLKVNDAIYKMADYLKVHKLGYRKVNFRLRDAIFSRQRYWGEPFPIYYKEGMPYALDEHKLPLLLPEVDKFLPTESGEPPLGRAQNWVTEEGYPLELNTMPGFAGSSAYFLRYMDPHNSEALVAKDKNEYWRNVDIYFGGSEHATGHLIYSRFWNMFLYDRGYICEEEPFKKLVNQGMIQGRSNFVYRVKGTDKYVTLSKMSEYDVQPIHVDIHIVHNDRLDLEAFRKSQPDRGNAEFILEEDGTYHCGFAIEKMSKTYLNVVNPDDIIEEYGADTLRMYEMFLGPLDQSKPWDTNGIDGVFRFLRRSFALLYNDADELVISDEKATPEELKALHTAILKINQGMESYSFNTCVSAFMICVNELTALKSRKREILEPFTILLAPFAPHLAEEMWRLLGHRDSVVNAPYPIHNDVFLKESEIKYPISFNGKVRFTLTLSAEMTREAIEEAVRKAPEMGKYLDGKAIAKIIVVPGRIVNIVTGK
ncbi:MAG: leucine--tRNA ligase [Bacteroidales bacterium]|uniref:leucine--tRNA ligase n=1 Tax=Porphyromonas sp. TaxID=1924944 RepID=UPI002977F752|nr:leucine--tRNA ligase [Porphyromonas sp.]MDD7438567.1 leucine--tRNA ligase [Bacteroidales bacterium]MDY3066872.1 leucine--tRNA ligase [Porphyromonas sp.]